MRRTNTTNFTTFNLPFPDAVTFTFPSPTSPDAIHISIPTSSSWRMRLHWHPSESHAANTTTACQRLTCLSGYIHVYVAKGVSGSKDRFGSAGMVQKFVPGQRVAWGRSKIRDQEYPLTVDLVADHVLWRNICSAILDRDIFPQLASTPWWLRALFAMLAAVVPSWRNRLLSLMLWIQVRSIFFAHDFHLFHGYVPIIWPWTNQPFGEEPPDWAARLQSQSKYFIAWAVMATSYWAGRLFLGMKGEYVEYTPRRNHPRDDKR